MAKFVLTAQLQLQAPRNVQQIVRQIQSQLSDVRVKVDIEGASKAQTDLKKLDKGVKQVTDSAHKMGQAFAVSVKRFAAFSIATRAIGLLTRGLGGAVSEAIDFERQLVKVSQVTGKSVKDLKGLTREITRLSTSLGVSSKSLIEVSKTLSQAGLDARETKVALDALAKTSLAATFTDIHQTAEGAVAIFNQFGAGAEALEKQLGSINAVAGQFAVEAGDIISAIRRTGGVFKAAGGDLNELIALFTSVRATTRESAESIATGLRTIFTRIQRPSTIKFLKQLGVELVDAEGKFVGPFKAVQRLSEAMSNLKPGDLRFVQIAEQLGGFRQIGKVIPLLQQFAVAQDALNVALDGQNSLAADAEKAQGSLAVRIVKVKEEFLALIRATTESKTFQVMANTALSLASALIKIAEALKPLLPLLAAMAAMKIFGGIKSFSGGLIGKAAAGGAKGFASGGLVPGSGNRDTVPAMLTPGEFVIKKSSVKSIGSDRLAGMNKYAKGGLVANLQENALGVFGLSPTKGDNFYSSSIKDAGAISNPKAIRALRSMVPGGGRKEKAQSDDNKFESMSRDEQYAFVEKHDPEGFNDFVKPYRNKKDGKIPKNAPKMIGNKGRHKGFKNYAFNTRAMNEFAGMDIIEPVQMKVKGQMVGAMLGAEGVTTKTRGKGGSLEGGQLLKDTILNSAAFGLKEAINDMATSKPVQDILKNKNSVIKVEASEYDAQMASLVAPKSDAVATVAGYVNEGLIQAITGAKVAGGGTRFDFPSVQSESTEIAKLYGNQDLKDMVSADAKPNFDFPAIAQKYGASANTDPSTYATGTYIKSIKEMSKFARGGSVTDTVPALLTPGEFVVNKQSAQGIGYGNLNRMNSRGVEGFASGGIVGGPRKFAEGGGAGGGMSGGMMAMAAMTALPMATEAITDLVGATEKQKASIDDLTTRVMAAAMMFMFIKGKINDHASAVDEAAKKAIDSGEEWAKKMKSEGASDKAIGAEARSRERATAGQTDTQKKLSPEVMDKMKGLGGGSFTDRVISGAKEKATGGVFGGLNQDLDFKGELGMAKIEMRTEEETGKRDEARIRQGNAQVQGMDNFRAQEVNDAAFMSNKDKIDQGGSDQGVIRGRRKQNDKEIKRNKKEQKRHTREVASTGEELDRVETTIQGKSEEKSATTQRLNEVQTRGEELNVEGPAAVQAVSATREAEDKSLIGLGSAKEAAVLDREQQDPMAKIGGRFRPRTEEEEADLGAAKDKVSRLKQGLPVDGGEVGGGAGGTVAQMQVQAQQVIIQAQSVTMTEGDVNVPVPVDEKAVAAAEQEVAALQAPKRVEAGTYSDTETRQRTPAEAASLASFEQVQSTATDSDLRTSGMGSASAVSGASPEANQAIADASARHAENVQLAVEAEERLVSLQNEALALGEEHENLLTDQAALTQEMADLENDRQSALVDQSSAQGELTASQQVGIDLAQRKADLEAETEANANKLTRLYDERNDIIAEGGALLDEQLRIEKELASAVADEKKASGAIESLEQAGSRGAGGIAAAQGAKTLTSALGKDSEEGQNVAKGMGELETSITDVNKSVKAQQTFLRAYSKELKNGVGAQKAYKRAMNQAGAAHGKIGSVVGKGAAAIRGLGNAAKGAANKVKGGFAKLNDKMAGMGKALGGVLAAGQAAVSFVQNLQQEQFDKAIESGDADAAEGQLGGMAQMDQIGGAVQGAAMGAAMGAMFGPLGMAIGAIVGAIGGWIMALAGADKKQIEREKKIHGVRLKAAQESTGKAMESIGEKGLQEGNLKDMNAGFKKQEALMNKKNTVDGQMLLSEEERSKMEKRLAGEQLKAATMIGKSVKTEAELEAAMHELTNDTIGSSDAEMDAAKTAFFVAQANRELAKSNADLIKITSAFQRATSAVDNFVNGLETGTNKFDSIVSDLEMSQKNIALGQGGVASVDAARDATMKGLERAGVRGDSDVGQAVGRSFDTMENTATFMSNLPGKLENLSFGEDKSAKGARDTIRGQLMTANMDPKMKAAMEKGMAGMSDEQLEAIARGEGDISQLISSFGTQMNKLGSAGLEAAKALQKHEATIIKLTQKRIIAEQNYIEAQKNSIDIMMEANEIIAKVGGPAVTPEMKNQATLAKANLSGDRLGLSKLQTGDAGELRQRTNEIMQKFGQQEIAGRTPGTFQGSQGLDDDKRGELKKAMQDQIALHRDLIKGKMEELKILDKKNALEKSSLEDALKGDMQSFLKKQAAVGATAAAASGDQRMMRMFGVDAIATAFSNIEKMKSEGVQEVHGVGIQDVSRNLASTGLAMRGLGGNDQMTNMLAGQLPEQEALKNEIKDLAVGLSETGQGAAQLAEMEVDTANITISTANFKFNEQLNQAAGLFAGGAGVDQRRWGGRIYASRGMFVPRGTDTVPAMLTPGEFVVRKESVNRGNNLQLLRSMNNGSMVAEGSSVGFAKGGRVGYYQRGDVVSQGAGIGLDPTVVNNLSASLMSFNKDLAKNISSLENMKFQIRLDTTNINVNLNGTSFLAQLKDSLKEELLAEVGSRIKELKFNDAGEPQTSSSVLG